LSAQSLQERVVELQIKCVQLFLFKIAHKLLRQINSSNLTKAELRQNFQRVLVSIRSNQPIVYVDELCLSLYGFLDCDWVACIMILSVLSCSGSAKHRPFVRVAHLFDAPQDSASNLTYPKHFRFQENTITSFGLSHAFCSALLLVK
jgi:hypothetical protein